METAAREKTLQDLEALPESYLTEAWTNLIHMRLVEEGLTLLRQGFQPASLDELAAGVVTTAAMVDICKAMADVFQIPIQQVQDALQEETKRAVVASMTRA